MNIDKYKFGMAKMLFDAEKDGGGATGDGGQPAAKVDDGTPAADGNNATGDGGGATGDGGQPAAKVDVYRPDGLPDHLFGDDEKSTIDNLFKAYKGARTELSGKKNIPDNLDDYKIELPEDVAKTILRPSDDGKDPIFEHMRGVFHKHGISQDIAIDLYKEYAASATAAINAAKDQDAGKDSGDFEFSQFGGLDKAKPTIDAHKTFITGLVNSGKITQDTATELDLMTVTSEGLKAMNELRSLLGDKPIPASMSGGHGSQDITESMLNERVADDRYRTASKKFDKSFRDETDRLFAEFYNNKKTG